MGELVGNLAMIKVTVKKKETEINIIETEMEKLDMIKNQGETEKDMLIIDTEKKAEWKKEMVEEMKETVGMIKEIEREVQFLIIDQTMKEVDLETGQILKKI